VDETGEGSTLPGKEHELENLTEYNTALNRRIIALPVAEEVQRKRPRGRVSFNEDETVINPEDVDPSIGRFRNMVATAVISSSSKRHRALTEMRETPKKIQRLSWSSRSDDSLGGTMVNSLGIVMNAAPDISLYPATLPQPRSLLKSTDLHRSIDDQEPHKKKYAKEAWPGRKPTAGF